MRTLALLGAAFAGVALAHDGRPHSEALEWTFDPLIVAPLLLVLALFLAGWWRLSRRTAVPRRRAWLFVGGWAVLALSLVSPLHEGGERSFTLHMIEHELIMLVATLLIAAAHAGGILAWGLPRPLRQVIGRSWRAPFVRAWRRLTEPVTATLLQAGVMWLWHAPALFDRALASQSWHIAQHASFVIASLIFWAAMLQRRRAGYLVAAACLFATSLLEGALGALMALSSSPWYAAYAAMPLTGVGLDPATDQQLAGLIMWVPGGLVHGAAALALLYAWLKANGENNGLRSQ